MLHGPQDGLRLEVVKALIEEKGPKAAFRYACCGLGDMLHTDGSSAKVHPRGCGHRLCPRCSRKRGSKMARRVFEHLARLPHGDIHTMCLTQRVDPEESLPAARKRMLAKSDRYVRRLYAAGVVSSMSSTHIVWSQAKSGWHYHIHLLLESPAGVFTPRGLIDLWVDTAAPEWVANDIEASRLVIPAGAAMPELEEDSGDTHFWKESTNEACRAIQYPLRDMVQGVAMFRFGGDAEKAGACVRVLLRDASGWKLRCTRGRWRKRPPPVPAAPDRPDGDQPGSAEVKPAPLHKEIAVGQVCAVYRSAMSGDRTCCKIFKMLENSVGNSSDFARRLVAFCRRAQGGTNDG